MSLPSVTNPLAWVNPANQSPSAAANGRGNFTLMQALQSGTTSAATAVAGATGGQGHPHHGHHGGGGISAQQLLSMLQQLNGGGASGATTPAATASGATTTGGTATPVTLQAMLQNFKSGSTASRGVGGLLNATA